MPQLLATVCTVFPKQDQHIGVTNNHNQGHGLEAKLMVFTAFLVSAGSTEQRTVKFIKIGEQLEQSNSPNRSNSPNTEQSEHRTVRTVNMTRTVRTDRTARTPTVRTTRTPNRPNGSGSPNSSNSPIKSLLDYSWINLRIHISSDCANWEVTKIGICVVRKL